MAPGGPALVIATAAALAAAALALPAQSDDRVFLGSAHAIANDSIGQFRDRWQSSAVMGSLFYGPDGVDPLSLPPGRLLEFRLSHQLVTPEVLGRPGPRDRPFAGTFALEVLTHGRMGATETSLGAGVAVTGPQTGSFRFQRWLHAQLGYPIPRPGTRMVPDGIHPVVTAEIGRSLGQRPRVRPFVEARAGLETLLRAGVDLTWGPVGTGRVMLREPVTGQRVPAMWGPPERGLSVTLGADVAAVGHSVLLPGLEPEPRLRLRAGVRWQGARWSLGYGAAWLSPEFVGQREGQVVGLVQVGARF